MHANMTANLKALSWYAHCIVEPATLTANAWNFQSPGTGQRAFKPANDARACGCEAGTLTGRVFSVHLAR